MKKLKLRRPPAAVLIALAAVLVIASITLAWLTVGDAITNRQFGLSNFDAYAELSFEGAVNPISHYQNPDKSLNVNVTNAAAENYIGKLRVTANYKGKGSAYLRVKVLQQWEKGGEILQADSFIPFGIATPYGASDSGDQSKWFYNRKNDFCFYYATVLKLDNNSFQALPLIISGFDGDKMKAISPSGANLSLAFTLEAVQVDRYPQFWHMETLPWES